MENKNITKKEQFSEPEIEIIEFDAKDIICTSGGFPGEEDGAGNE